MVKKQILFDLDGTVIDSSQRLYSLFKFLVRENNFTFDNYWKLKRQMVSHSVILEDIFKWEQTQITHFQNKWMSLIETEYWLSMDQPFDGAPLVLENLKAKGFDLYLFTARQSKENTINQLISLELLKYFDSIFVTEQKMDKIELITSSRLNILKTDISVGDTGKDIELARNINCISVAVESGFRNKEVLKMYSPDFIIPSISDPEFMKIVTS